LADVVLRLVATLDAEISISVHADDEFVERWRQVHPGKLTLPATDLGRRSKRIERLVGKLGLPQPLRTDEIDVLLRARNLTH
jgi:hypothetical protein